MKAFTSQELREFPEILVPRLWAALCERLQEPVTVQERRGVRIVDLLGCARYYVMPGARLVHFASGIGRGKFEAGAMGGCVAVDPVLPGSRWLALYAANWLVTRGAAVAPGDMDRFIVEVEERPAFLRLLERVRACRIVDMLRPKLVEALALDPRILAWARLGFPREQRVVITSRQYTTAWRRAEGFAQVERECPVLLRPYAGAAQGGLLGRHEEPARDLKLAFRDQGLGDAAWKVLVTANRRCFEAALAGSANANAFEVYCWVLAASLAADRVLPPAVMARLVMPYGREPGNYALLRAHRIAESTWLKPFLRALARRLDAVDGVEAMREFLDGEFEDVLDWLEWETPGIDANQARAGWAWMLKQRNEWQERQRQAALAGRERSPWPVPLERLALPGVEIVALTDSFQLWEEGRRMRHCVRTHAEDCALGEAIVFSMRTPEGERLATGMLQLDDDGWDLAQVRMVLNRPAPAGLVDCASAFARATNEAQEELCLRAEWLEGENDGATGASERRAA